MNNFESNENLFKKIFFEHSAIMLLIEPETGKILRSNKAAQNFYGYSIEQLSEMKIQEINLLSPQEVEKERMLAVQEKRNHFIFPHKLANGETRLVEVHSSPINWEGSRILFSIIHDVTIRQKFKKALVESQKKFELLFENAPSAILLANLENGNVLDANKAATELFVRSKEEIVGKHFTNLNSQKFIKNKLQKLTDFKSILETEKEFGATVSFIVLQDGKRVAVEETSTTIILKKQKLLLGMFRDVSRRYEIEKTLRENEKRLHFAIEGNNDGLWDWNTVTNEVFYSKRWKEMIGYEENEILNDISEWEKRVHPEDLELVYERLNKHLKGENHFYRSEHRLKSKDGSYKWILDRGKVVSWTEDKKPLRVVGTHTDITIQKETEIENKRLLKELKEALGKVKTLSGFLPICAKCKKIRDDEGYWNQIENYIREHSDAKFSHGICPECAKVLYPEIYKKI